MVCGDVRGNFKLLFNRIETINKKSGPFELLLCVGDFFADNNDELQAYLTGNKQGKFPLNTISIWFCIYENSSFTVTVPTYILGPTGPNSCDHYSTLNDGELCSNLTYLGKRGLYTISSGIKIAYVSGVESASEKSDWTFDKEDVKAVRNSCLASRTSAGEFRGVDILITSQWPQGIYEKEKNTSKLISWLATEIKPRYHFCGLNGVYHEPAPYRNSANNNTQLELASRFVALANIGNAEKSKYIYALSIVSVDKMRITELLQKTTNETSCPYEQLDLMKDTVAQSQENSSQFFYDTNSFNQNDQHGHQRKRKGFGYQGQDQKRERRVFDQEKCWFCLSSSSVEKHLVITIGEHFYLALAKGPINEGHILILSVTHIQSASLLAEESWTELDKFKDSLRIYFKSMNFFLLSILFKKLIILILGQNKVVSFFERNYKSSHLQINVIAVDESIEWQLKNTFEDKSEEYNLDMETLPKLTAATELPAQGPYFVAELPNNTTLLTRKMKMFPLHYGREIFCAENVLNCEPKIDWKDCSLSRDEEIELVKKFRENYKPFDFTL